MCSADDEVHFGLLRRGCHWLAVFAQPVLFFHQLREISCAAILIGLLTIAAAPVQAAPSPSDHVVDEAIVKALRYLARQQLHSGGWKLSGTQETTSGTSLAVMAFLAAGHTPGEGPYGEAIVRGVQFVIDHQDASGLLYVNRGHQGPMYDHGISTLMLAEVSGMVPERMAAPTRKALERAIRLILASQMVPKPANQRGGWRYTPQSTDSDLSVTGWQLLALRAAKDIGCDVPAENIDVAVDYVKRCSPNTGRGFGYQPGNGATPVLSATGMLALQLCGQEESAEVHRAAEYLEFRPLRLQDQWYYYGIYYTSVGMFKRGGDSWKNTRPILFADILSHQSAEGQWETSNGNEAIGGPVYMTSMAVLALTVEYEYLPIYQR